MKFTGRVAVSLLRRAAVWDNPGMTQQTGRRTPFDLLMVVGPILVLVGLLLTVRGSNPPFGVLIGVIGVAMVVVWKIRE